MDIFSFIMGVGVGGIICYIIDWLTMPHIPDWVIKHMDDYEQEPILNTLAKVPGLEIHLKGPEIEEKKQG